MQCPGVRGTRKSSRGKARTTLGEGAGVLGQHCCLQCVWASNFHSYHTGTNSSLGGGGRSDRGKENLTFSHPSCFQGRATWFSSRKPSKRFFPGEPAFRAPQGKMLKRSFQNKKPHELWADPLSYFHWKCYFVSHAGPMEPLCWKLKISLSHFSLLKQHGGTYPVKGKCHTASSAPTWQLLGKDFDFACWGIDFKSIFELSSLKAVPSQCVKIPSWAVNFCLHM